MSNEFNQLYGKEVDYYGGQASPSLVRYLKMFNVSGPGTALDLGCGQGRNSEYLAQQGFSVLGVDNSAEAVACLTDNVVGQIADIAEFDITPNHYQLIVANTSIDHLSFEQNSKVVQNIINGLAPGGYVFVSVFMTNDPKESETASYVKLYYPMNQLKEQFASLTLLSYQEEFWLDEGHGNPHYHSMARLFAQREK
jgi:2-polyprenyl-3-methyl-5-hydroxy-6-metoxy-1,4-benzoquinol methylase